MLPYEHKVISVLLKPLGRLNALSSGYDFGTTNLSDEHHLEKLDSFIKNLENEFSFNQLADLRNRPYPDLKRSKSANLTADSDLLLGENFRQHKNIEERYRKKLSTVTDIRNINDGLTKIWKSISRGYERTLVDLFNNLDGEGYNRKSILPILDDDSCKC